MTNQLAGIDVSNNNGAIQWDVVAAAGVQFAIIKATEGASFVDAFLDANLAGARANGVACGLYHFADVDTTPEAEAQHFLSAALPRLGAGEVAALDVERGAGRELAWVQAWLTTVGAALGCKPWLYASPNGLAVYGLQDLSLADNGLWLASWRATLPPTPAPWPFIACHQYSSTGSIPGIQGAVDMDEFQGSLKQFQAYGRPRPSWTNDDLAQAGHLLFRLDAAGNGDPDWAGLRDYAGSLVP